ncbi:hypothetical protein ABZ934_23900 [Streptomyces sp. NPDC046557]
MWAALRLYDYAHLPG